MQYIPNTGVDYNDTVDLLIKACEEIVYVRDPNTGEVVAEKRENAEQIYWETRLIDSNEFGDHAKKVKQLERKGQQASENMSPPRARVVQNMIEKMIEEYKTAINAKASEIRMDKHNPKQSLIHIIQGTAQKSVVQPQEEIKQGFLAGMFGKKKEEE